VLQLARLRYKDDKLDEAADMLERLLSAHPDYLRAHDALVDVRLRQGAREQAMSILKQASARSNANVARMRRLGNLAEDLGDLEMAEQVFGQVLERTRDSGMLSGEDYSNLSRLFVAQGKLDKLDKLANDQKKMLKGHKDLELSTALLEFHQLQNSPSARRDAAVRNLIAIEAQDVAGEFSPRLVVQVIRACLEWGQEDAGFKIATRMAKRAKLDTVVLHEMQDILDRHRVMQRQSRVVGVDELSNLVRGAEQGGLDDAARRSIERSLMAARSRDSNDGRLDEIEQRWRSVKARQPVPRSA
jgi:tetratricopeptide (TPR) repeat protein